MGEHASEDVSAIALDLVGHGIASDGTRLVLYRKGQDCGVDEIRSVRSDDLAGLCLTDYPLCGTGAERQNRTPDMKVFEQLGGDLRRLTLREKEQDIRLRQASQGFSVRERRNQFDNRLETQLPGQLL